MNLPKIQKKLLLELLELLGLLELLELPELLELLGPLGRQNYITEDILLWQMEDLVGVQLQRKKGVRDQHLPPGVPIEKEPEVNLHKDQREGEIEREKKAGTPRGTQDPDVSQDRHQCGRHQALRSFYIL